VWSSIVFVIALILHTYFNWVALVCYFKTKVHRGLALRAEWFATLAVYRMIYAGTIYEVAPFSTLMVWKETFKHEGPSTPEYGQGRQGRIRENTIKPDIIEQQAELHEQEQSQLSHRDGSRSGME
jgi:hypothetical protein